MEIASDCDYFSKFFDENASPLRFGWRWERVRQKNRKCGDLRLRFLALSQDREH